MWLRCPSARIHGAGLAHPAVMTRTTSNHSRLTTAWVAALLGMAATVGACERERGADVEAVVEEPAEYYGKQVTVTGEVTEIYSPRAFALESGGLIDETILVVTKTPIQVLAPMTLDVEDDIAVTGMVRQMVVADVEQELGWDLEETLEVEYQGKPVIVAQSLSFLREAGAWREGVGYETREPGAVGTAPMGEEMRGGVEQVAIIIAAVPPTMYAGRQVTLEDVSVREVASDKAFWIGGETREQQMLVVLEEPPGGETKADVNAGQTVTIRGTLQPMPAPAQAMQQWNLKEESKSALKQDVLYLRAQDVQKGQV